MEMLVVMAVFSVVVVITADIFFTVTRSQHRAAEDQQVQGDIRFAVDAMAREIHQGSIDYDYYGSSLSQFGQPAAQSVLALLDSTGRVVRFQGSTTPAGVPTLQVCRGGCTSWEPLLSDNVKVPTARFYLVPASNPLLGGVGAPNDYPRVTMILSAQPAQPTKASSIGFFLQTTVALRSYRR